MMISSAKMRAVLLAATALALGVASCGGDGEVKHGLNINVCGPPSSEFDLDPFGSCYFLKVCYKVEGETKLRNCELVEFLDGEMDFAPLPLDEKIAIVAECYDNDPTAEKATPRNLVSKGQSVPVKWRSGDAVADINIYMLKPSSFGPTLSFGEGLFCTGETTKPYAERWGAVSEQLFDGTILLAGGVDDLDSNCGDWSDPGCIESATSTAELYDPRSGTFTLVGTSGTSALSQKRAFAASVALPDGRVAIFGGVSADGEPTNTVDLYDPVGLSFTEGLPMTDPRAYHTATLISDLGYVLLVGGLGGEATWEVWTPDQGSLLVQNNQLHESRWHHTATLVTKDIDSAVKRDMVVIAGGEGGGEPGSATPRNTIEIFDINAQTIDPLPVALCSNEGPDSPAPAAKTMHAAAFVPKRHFLYFAGGFKDGKHLEPTKDICVWHSTQEKWSGEAGTFMLRTGRGALSATALPGNVVLFAGGLGNTDDGYGAVETVEIVFEYLNDKGETVVDIGPGVEFPIPMLSKRWDHGARLTADGKVLFFGGLTGPASSPTMVLNTELFNPQ